MAPLKTLILGLCSLLAGHPHVAAITPIVDSSLSDAASPSVTASQTSSTTGQGGFVAFPFSNAGFALPTGKQKVSSHARITQMEGTIADMDTLLQGLEDAVTNLTVSHNTTEGDVATLGSDVSTLQSRVASITTDITVIQQSQAAATEPATAIDYSPEIEALSTRISSVTDELATVRSTLTQSIADVDGKVVTLQGLESSLAALENQVTGYNTQINDLSNSIASAALSSDLVELETSIGHLEGRIASAEEQNMDQVSQSVVDGLETRTGVLENVLGSLVTSGVDDTSCESPWSYRSGPATCIYAAHDVEASWIEARAWCEAMGPQYRLYIVNAFQKHTDLTSYINSELSDTSSDYYIGFSALNNQNYKWVDGSSEFSKWAWCWEKPDFQGHACGSVKNDGGFCLEDRSCEIKQKFICEKVIS